MTVAEWATPGEGRVPCGAGAWTTVGNELALPCLEAVLAAPAEMLTLGPEHRDQICQA